MDGYYVSPSYVGLKTVGDVYEKNGKCYIKVVLKSGKTKEVRAYESKEDNSSKTVDLSKCAHAFYDEYKVYGFKPKGFIYALRGDSDVLRNIANSSTYFNWYVGCNTDISDLPMGLKIKKVDWLDVCDNNLVHLKPEKEVREYVDNLFKEG